MRTGGLKAFTSYAEGQAKTNPALRISLLIGFVVLASAFISNTPLVIVIILVFVQLARSLKLPASKSMIPFSYAAVLSGILTLWRLYKPVVGWRGPMEWQGNRMSFMSQ